MGIINHLFYITKSFQYSRCVRFSVDTVVVFLP